MTLPPPAPPGPPPPPPADPERSRFDRFRNEVMAGGTERALPPPVPDGVDDDAAATGAGRIAGLVILGLFAWLAFSNVWMFLFVLGVLVSVFLHETGHFVTARLTGMKATQFFLGFGPRLWSFRRGETEYGVRALPLGAFVRIIGMNRMDEVPLPDEGRTYRQQSYPKRLLVITAGSLMHLLLGVGLFFTVFATKGEQEQVPGAEVQALAAGGPAEQAGIRPGDVIVGIDGTAVADPEEVGEAVRSHEPGATVSVVVERDGERLAPVDATLVRNTEPGELYGTSLLGVSSSSVYEWQDMSLASAAVTSVTEIGRSTWASIGGVVKVLNPVNIWDHVSGQSDDVETRPTTLVGVTQVSGAVGEHEGFIGLLFLLGALNIFVGVFNMFPLLPLDGGHAAIATYERVREGRGRRRYFADVERLMPFTMGVIVLLLVLFMSGLYLDLAKPLG